MWAGSLCAASAKAKRVVGLRLEAHLLRQAHSGIAGTGSMDGCLRVSKRVPRPRACVMTCCRAKGGPLVTMGTKSHRPRIPPSADRETSDNEHAISIFNRLPRRSTDAPRAKLQQPSHPPDKEPIDSNPWPRSPVRQNGPALHFHHQRGSTYMHAVRGTALPSRLFPDGDQTALVAAPSPACSWPVEQGWSPPRSPSSLGCPGPWDQPACYRGITTADAQRP